jgi:protein SCO1
VAPGLRIPAIILATALAATPVALPAADPGTIEAPQLGGHFNLLAADGTVVSDRSFPGKWLLLYFGYTSCPDACPTALSTIAAALHQLAACRTEAAD